VRTLWGLVAAMRDESVDSIILQGHIGLGGAPLPPITGGRDLKIVGECNNPSGRAWQMLPATSSNVL
jgi:hypothetical protein